MNSITIGEKNWKFPENITIEDVLLYSEVFKEQSINNNITFDLSDTDDLHSSFIGFLIHAKDIMNKNGNKIFIMLSRTTEKILKMLNLLDHFTQEILPLENKKTA